MSLEERIREAVTPVVPEFAANVYTGDADSYCVLNATETPDSFGNNRPRAIRHLEKGRVVIFGCGIGSPFFSTDTAAVLRAAEIGADVILLAKNIDGVYDSDPAMNPAAKRYDTISIQEVIDKKLAVVDLTASIMCMEHRMPMAVFDLNEKDSIANAMRGKINGTIVTVD